MTEDHPSTGGSAAREADFRQALSSLADLPADSPSLSATLTSVATFAVLAIPRADGAGVTLLHPERDDTIVASSPFVREVDAIQYGIGEGPCITAADTGRTMRSGSLGVESRWPRFGSRVRALGVLSALSLPLIAQGRVIGSMNVYAKSADAFDDDAVRLGEAFAAPAAVSLQNARALDDAMELARRLETALQQRSMVDRAIGILIARRGCTATEAFDELRSRGRREDRRVDDIAERLVDDVLRGP